jgi:hypothetical protein
MQSIMFRVLFAQIRSKHKKVNLLTTATTAGSSVASGPTATSQVSTLILYKFFAMLSVSKQGIKPPVS